LFTKDLDKVLTGFFEEATTEILIFSAYCTHQAVAEVLQNVSKNVKIKVITRWRKEDILKGSSDLKVFDVVREKGGTVYRHPDLHLKFYVRDKQQKIFGSANLTNRGIGLHPNANNIENLTSIETFTVKDTIFANQLINDAQEVTAEMVEEFQRQLDENEDEEEWDEEKVSCFDNSKEGIFVNDFPFTNHPKEVIENPYNENVKHDREIFDLPKKPDENQIRNGFLDSKIYKWLVEFVEDEMYFGEMTAKIHNSLLDEPKPYRKKVKEIQSNLFSWVDYLETIDFEIQTPQNSDVIVKLHD